LCTAENGFREILLPGGDTILTAFAYGSCDEKSRLTVKITFQANMSNQTIINNDVQVVIKNPWI
jgi:hypothetical protein